MTAFAQRTVRTQKEIKTDFLQEMALLMIAESPLKTDLKEACQRFRGGLVARLDPATLKQYLNAREVIVTFADMMAKAEDLNQIAHALSYIQALQQQEVLIVEDPAEDEDLKARLQHYFHEEHATWFPDEALTEIIHIVHNLHASTKYHESQD